jgi:hypothetical protein
MDRARVLLLRIYHIDCTNQNSYASGHVCERSWFDQRRISYTDSYTYIHDPSSNP